MGWMGQDAGAVLIVTTALIAPNIAGGRAGDGWMERLSPSRRDLELVHREWFIWVLAVAPRPAAGPDLFALGRNRSIFSPSQDTTSGSTLAQSPRTRYYNSSELVSSAQGLYEGTFSYHRVSGTGRGRDRVQRTHKGKFGQVPGGSLVRAVIFRNNFHRNPTRNRPIYTLRTGVVPARLSSVEGLPVTVHS